MARLTRRHVLGFGLPAISMLAGCGSANSPQASPGGRPTTAETNGVRTRTTTEDPELDPSILSIEGTVLDQATAETPLTVESVVRNEGEQEVQLSPSGHGGQALEYLPRMTNGDTELVLLPRKFGVGTSGGLAEEPTAGCWRFVTTGGEPATRTVISTSQPVTIESGGRYVITHEVYQDASSGDCLPEGTYEADVSVAGGHSQNDVNFVMDMTYVLSIDTEGKPDFTIATIVE